MKNGARKRAVVAIVAAALCWGGVAMPHTLTVPFFRDEGSTMGQSGPQTGAAGVISVRNTRDVPVDIYLVYAINDVTGDANVQQATAPYTLPARGSVSWRPAQDDPAEGEGRNVPNVLAGSGNFGSVTVYWIGGDEMAGALVGRYHEFTSSRAMMHVLTGSDDN